MTNLLGIFFTITLCMLVGGLINQRRSPLATAAGAIVMSSGIIINGSMQQSPFFRDKLAPFAVICILILLFLFIYKYGSDGINKVFKERHLQNPISSFGIGTWVAAISVSSLAIIKEIPSLKLLAVIMFISNIPLYFAYLWVVVRNYRYIWRAHPANKDLLNQMNGVVLLACVATQSIVATGTALCPSLFSTGLWKSVVLIGIIFYVLGMYFILRRYLSLPVNLPQEWTNTNCIIHGALSITGLTLTMGHLLSPNRIVTLWVLVLIIFIIVECVEILRLVQLVSNRGWKKGIFTYSVTQWSRNFTFGMLDAFTFNLPLSDSYLKHQSLFVGIHSAITLYWKYVVLTLFVVQVVLFQLDYLESRKEQRNRLKQINS